MKTKGKEATGREDKWLELVLVLWLELVLWPELWLWLMRKEAKG